MKYILWRILYRLRYAIPGRYRLAFLVRRFRAMNLLEPELATLSDWLIALLIVIPILSVNQVRFELSNSYKEPIQIMFSLEEWCHER